MDKVIQRFSLFLFFKGDRKLDLLVCEEWDTTGA